MNISRSIIVWAALLAAPTRVAADAASDARTHSANAATAYKAGDYELARSELQAAHDLDPQPALLYALGQVNVKLGKCADAIGFYEQYLATSPSTDSADTTRQAISVCKLALEQAKRETPTTTTTPPPTGTGEMARRPPPPPPPETAPTPWFRRPIGVALLGGGVVGLGASAILFASARSLQSSAASATSYERALELDRDAHDRRTISLVVGGVGAALVVGGVLYYMLGTPPRSSAGLAITPSAGGAIVSWGGDL